MKRPTRAANTGFTFRFLMRCVVPVTVLISCTPSSVGGDPIAACDEYERAFFESPELDDAGAAVVEALGDQRISDLQDQLIALETELNQKYPSWGEMVLAGDTDAIENRFGTVGLGNIQEFSNTFRRLNEAIRAECAALTRVEGNSEEAPATSDSSVVAPTVTTTSTVPTPALFLLDPPMLWGFCYEMDLPICSTEAYRQSTLKLEYRLPPPNGIPKSSNRDENFWNALTKMERNDYLYVTLWDWAAKLGVSGGVQSLDQAQIKGEYEYMLEWAVWFVNVLNSGSQPVAVLESMRAELGKYDDPQWLIDYRINMVRWVALPALAPQYISEVDEVIVNRS